MPELPKRLKIAITGGGTGGHIYPAIAVAQNLKQDNDIEKIFYIGCEKNMEKEAAEKENIEFYSIKVSGMPRKNILKLTIWLFELFFAVVESVTHLSKLKPDAVFGTGGYVSGAVLIAAKILNIPFVMHDSDAHPGIVSRFMARWAYAVTVSFEQAKTYISAKNIVLSGNPIRSDFMQIKKEEAIKKLGIDADKKTILVMGGSQGAQTINNALINAVFSLVNDFGFQVIHQTGKKNYATHIEELIKKHPELEKNKNYIVQPFFNNMELPMNAADVAVARAGSLSISELNLCGLPSILVPYPYAAADHQRFNALAMQNAGASVFLADAECTSDRLIELICDILHNADKLENMRQANIKLAKPQATANIVKLIKETALR